MEFKRVKIIACKPMPNYRVWMRFDDDLEGVVDLNDLVGQGIFESWKSIEFFNQVRVDSKTDTLAWGEEIDLDPYVLREKVENSKKTNSSYLCSSAKVKSTTSLSLKMCLISFLCLRYLTVVASLTGSAVAYMGMGKSSFVAIPSKCSENRF